METVAFFLYNTKQYRTFVETDFTKDLRNSHKVDFILLGDQKLKSKEFLASTFFIPKIPSALIRLGTLLSTALLWKRKDVSRAHYFRALCTFGNKSSRAQHTTMIVYDQGEVNLLKKFLVRLISRGKTIFIINYLRKLLVLSILSRKLKQRIMDLEKYDYAIIPFSGLLTPEFDDLVRVLQKLKVKTVGIQENWDNLSSKTFMFSQPEFFLVWGNQSRGHLRSIHKNTKSIVHEIGSPRFIPYFVKSKMPITQKITRPYILLTGTGDGVDDEFIILETLKALQDLDSLSAYQLVFRPHPFTRNPFLHSKIAFHQFSEQSLIVDAGDRSAKVYHHCPLIEGASLVINQFSTILLEALACNVKILLPTFVSRKVDYDYSMAIDEWHHFMGLRSIPNVYLTTNKMKFSRDLLRALESPVATSSHSIDWMVRNGDSSQFLLEFNNLIKLRA